MPGYTFALAVRTTSVPPAGFGTLPMAASSHRLALELNVPDQLSVPVASV
jgi:hypothetical protein